MLLTVAHGDDRLEVQLLLQLQHQQLNFSSVISVCDSERHDVVGRSFGSFARQRRQLQIDIDLRALISPCKLAFHGADTDTDTDSPDTSIHPYVRYARFPREDRHENVNVSFSLP